MRLSDDLLTHLLSFMSFIELDKYFIILMISDEKQAAIKKYIYNQRFIIKKIHNTIKVQDKVFRFPGIATVYFIDDVMCRFDGPAIQFDDTKIYINNGKFHNTNGPAIKTNEGEIWYYNGKFHRQGAAAIWFNGIVAYYEHGKCHRLDGPAIEYADGRKEWYVNGERHRVGGPAIECINGCPDYWRNDNLHHPNDEDVISRSDNAWFLNGKLHNPNGPAVTQKGHQYWFQHGKKHRIDGPAVIYPNGKKEYWLNGKEQYFAIYTRLVGSLKGIFNALK